MISKELLSEVLGERIREFYIKGSVLEIIVLRDCNFAPYDHPPRIQKDCGIRKDINIYELAHKCKEWAWSKNFRLTSGIWDSDNKYTCDIFTENAIYQEEHHENGDTEPEAIFKACQWILENK
jgi:hypothetical protein